MRRSQDLYTHIAAPVSSNEDVECPACGEPLKVISDGRPDDHVRCGCTVVSLEWLRIANTLEPVVGDGLLEAQNDLAALIRGLRVSRQDHLVPFATRAAEHVAAAIEATSPLLSGEMGELIERLVQLREKATPELFTAKPHRIAQMLRDGAHAQVPKADNINNVDWEADATLILEAVNAIPKLAALFTVPTQVER